VMLDLPRKIIEDIDPDDPLLVNNTPKEII
jgi:adenylate kinase